MHNDQKTPKNHDFDGLLQTAILDHKQFNRSQLNKKIPKKSNCNSTRHSKVIFLINNRNVSKPSSHLGHLTVCYPVIATNYPEVNGNKGAFTL